MRKESATGSFRTAPVSEDSRFSFAVVGDSGSGGKGQLAVAALLGRLGPDLILHAGDVVYPAGEERHYDRRFFVPYRHLTRSVPLFPVLGNHDVKRSNGAAFFENFHPPRDNPRSTKRYYSFDWGAPTSSPQTASCITAIATRGPPDRRPSWRKT